MLAHPIEMDPKVRIQGLLETVDRYLNAYRQAEQHRQTLLGLCRNFRGIFEDIKPIIEEMEASPEGMLLLQTVTNVLEATDYMAEPAAAEESVGC